MISGIVSNWLYLCLSNVNWLLAQAVEPVEAGNDPMLAQGTDEVVNNVNPIFSFLSNPLNVLLISAMLFMLLVVRPSQRAAKDQQKALAELKKNDRVVTAGGIHGVVVQMGDDKVITLRIDDNSGARMTVNRDTISKIINPETKE